MTELATCDTNILIYSADASETAKYPIAKRLVDKLASTGSPLPLQVLNEFYFVCVRKQKLPLSEAEKFIRILTRTMDILPPTAEDLMNAIQRHRQHGQQFFDALLTCTASRAGCAIFFSEDTQYASVIGSMRIVNPFLLTPDELDTLLA